MWDIQALFSRGRKSASHQESPVCNEQLVLYTNTLILSVCCSKKHQMHLQLIQSQTRDETIVHSRPQYLGLSVVIEHWVLSFKQKAANMLKNALNTIPRKPYSLTPLYTITHASQLLNLENAPPTPTEAWVTSTFPQQQRMGGLQPQATVSHKSQANCCNSTHGDSFRPWSVRTSAAEPARRRWEAFQVSKLS